MEEKKNKMDAKRGYLEFATKQVREYTELDGSAFIYPKDSEESKLFIDEGCVIESGVEIQGNSIYIGKNVHIGKNCTIKSDYIYIGDNCLIYDDVFIVTIDLFKLGNRCKISRNCVFRCRSISISDELWCNENVDIGGGGCWQDTASLEIGKFVHIGKNAMINVCKPVHIGSRTGLGIESMIFTHSAGNGQSILKGYLHTEKEVWIGDNVSLYTRAFIAPGCVVADGTIIGAKSYVTRNTQKGLYAGTPAQFKKPIEEPDLERKEKIIFDILHDKYRTKVSIYQKNSCVNQLFNDAIVFFDVTDELGIDKIVDMHRNVVVISFLEGNPINLFKEKITYINFEKEIICGYSSVLSEEIRDNMRREGIILDYDEYIPKQLDYYGLREKGIER